MIVAVNGVCAGGGLHYVADADIAIASEDAWFTDPHVGVGQVSGIEAPSLGLRVPLAMLARMVLLGRHERWDAQQALALGLVTRGAAARRSSSRAPTSWPSWIAEASPEAVRRSRAVYRRFEEARRRRRDGRRLGLGATALGPSRTRRRTPGVPRTPRPGLAA